MSKKPSKPPAATGGRVIDFDALLGNHPTINVSGATFEGRAVNQTEKARWLDAERADDVIAQHAFIVAALNARGATVDAAWVGEQTDAALTAIVRGLFGLGWPGDEAREGN